MITTIFDIAAAAGAGMAAGVVNAIAGGGTLIAFPCLVALGVPTVAANVTSTVGQTPGYLAGAWTQRADLGSGIRSSWRLVAFAAGGALLGAVLLQATPDGVFKAVVPFLILSSCVLLVGQDRLRARLRSRTQQRLAQPDQADAALEAVGGGSTRALPAIIGLGGIYGGFFGAGLGIIMLAVLGLFSDAGMVRNNAVKQVLAFVVNLVAAAVFVAGHHVVWTLVPSLAAGSVLGGIIGAKAVPVVRPVWLRAFVVAFGLAVVIDFWV